MSADEAPRELSPAEGDVEAEAFGSPDQGDWLDAEASDAGAWSDDQELSEDGDSPDDEDWLEADETQPGE